MYGCETNARKVHFHVTARCEDVSVFGGRYNNFGSHNTLSSALISMDRIIQNMEKGGVTFRKITPNKYIFGENPFHMNGVIEMTGCYAGYNCESYRQAK